MTSIDPHQALQLNNYLAKTKTAYVKRAMPISKALLPHRAMFPTMSVISISSLNYSKNSAIKGAAAALMMGAQTNISSDAASLSEFSEMQEADHRGVVIAGSDAA